MHRCYNSRRKSGCRSHVLKPLQCRPMICSLIDHAFLSVFSKVKKCYILKRIIETNTQFCRIKGCGGAGCPPPPPIIFERLKLPQQIIYRRKRNLSESPNHFKYRKNMLISRFYEQFSRRSRILGHVWKFEKISNS